MKTFTLVLLASLIQPAFAASAPSALAEFAKCDASFYRLLGSNPGLLKNTELVSKGGYANFKLGPKQNPNEGLEEATAGMQESVRSVELKPMAQLPEGVAAEYYEERHFQSTKSFSSHENGKEELYRWTLHLKTTPKQLRSTLDKAGPKLPWQCEDGICTIFRQQQKAEWAVVGREKIDGNKPYLVLMLSEAGTDSKSSELECELRTEGRHLPKEAIRNLRPDWQ
ncbi:MAG TPA: hypothetical protein VLC08_05510 [Chitinolyticbacter sp.]|nr:hypothetical protein [Chitinolyticbacter sp.]